MTSVSGHLASSLEKNLPGDLGLALHVSICWIIFWAILFEIAFCWKLQIGWTHPQKNQRNARHIFLLSNPNIIFPISKHIAIQYPLANANSGWIGMSLNMFPKTYAYLPRQPTKTTEGKKMVSCHGMTLLPCCTVWSPLITKHFQKQSWYIIQIDALIFCHIPKKSIPPNPHPLNSLWISVDFTDSRHSLRDPFPAQPWPTPASPASSASCWAGPKAWGSGAAPVPRRGRWDKRGSKAPWTSYIQIIQRCWWW